MLEDSQQCVLDLDFVFAVFPMGITQLILIL